MNLIAELTQKITPTLITPTPLVSSQGSNAAKLAVSSDEEDTEQAAQSQQLLLEQFYAILLTHLQVKLTEQRLTDAQTSDSSNATNLLHYTSHLDALLHSSVKQPVLFSSLWQAADKRQMLVTYLADDYYVTPEQTQQLLTDATPKVCDYLKQLHSTQANISHEGSVSQRLQQEMTTIRAYLPQWAGEVIARPTDAAWSATMTANTLPLNDSTRSNQSINNQSINNQQESQSNINVEKNQSQQEFVGTALSANPALRIQTDKRVKKASTNNSKAMIAALLAMVLLAGLIWLAIDFYNKSKAEKLAEQQAVQIAAANANKAEAAVVGADDLLPASVSIKMDINQSIYECSAVVGDAAAQASLQQTLQSALAGQASVCQIKIEDKVTTTIEGSEHLPAIINAVLPVPFATMKLEANTVSLTAPDKNLLEQMSAAIQTAAPQLDIEILAPIGTQGGDDLSGLTNNEFDAAQEALKLNEGNNRDDGITNGANSVTGVNNEGVNNQAAANMADVNAGVGVANGQPNMPTQGQASSNQPIFAPQSSSNAPPSSGQISSNELDDLLNSTIVAEPAIGGKPINNPQ